MASRSRRIERGHFGDVTLDGLCFVVTYAWPGPIYEGNGEMQAIIDERADEAQRKALVTILHGGETEEAKTHWWVFHAMSSKVHDPLFAPIEVEVDIERRWGRASIPGVLESSGRPLRSPVSGDEHRVRIDLPNGIEFEIAEIGAASSKASGAVEAGPPRQLRPVQPAPAHRERADPDSVRSETQTTKKLSAVSASPSGSFANSTAAFFPLPSTSCESLPLPLS